jgi:hypothetical protein
MANVYTIKGAARKSQPDTYRDPRAKHIEEWVRVSTDARNKALGEDAFRTAETLYSLKGNRADTPSFRPSVVIPELQKISLEDANHLSDLSPQPYIFSDGDRVKDRETALQAEWQRARVNYHLLYASLYARYCGVGFIQLCYSADLYNGQGGMWAKARDPRTVHIDPGTDYSWDPSFLIFEDWMNLEEVRKRWPDTSYGVTPTSAPPPTGMDSGYGIQMPQGPMTSIPGMVNATNSKSSINDTRVLVRFCFCRDYTREVVEKKNIPDGALTDPEFQWKYPDGRWLVECAGIILQDGGNPWPQRSDILAPGFPLYPIWALPPLYGPWGVPSINLSLNLQSVAERMYTQLYENAVRLNNGTWFIDSNTGIDVEAFGAMPGEVQQINPNSRIPEVKYGGNMPSQAFQFPEAILKLQRMMHGQTDARQGNPGAGNISTDLFDASVLQASGLLQVSGRLQYFSLSLLATAMYRTMAKYIPRRQIPFRSPSGMVSAEWKGILRPDSHHDLYLDEDSVQPLSDAVIRKMAPELMKTGVLNTQRGLEILKFPGADEIAKEQKEQLELQALARVKGAKK